MNKADSFSIANKHLHFMGIGGQGISAVAQMARLAGAYVDGCDRAASATTRTLEQVGIKVQIGHQPAHLEGIEALVISAAIPALDPENPELLAARERKIPIIPWQELLNQLIADKCLLSVSGVHGKGTTTAMLALMLVEAGLDPSCEIGAIVPRFGANYRLGESAYFINEADEFNHNFWHYHPRLIIVTSIEFEHPEFFADYEAFLQAFEHFIQGMDLQSEWPLPPTLILNADSPGCLELDQRLADWPVRRLLYSVNSQIDLNSARKSESATSITLEGDVSPDYEAYAVTLEGETSFKVRARTDAGFPTERVIRLQLPGLLNIQNALAALTAARAVGVEPEPLIRALEDFQGTRRRFEIRHQGPLKIASNAAAKPLDLLVIDDYAHHPTAIVATLKAAHQRYPGRRLVAVYQPHMYSRTHAFFAQFQEAFDEADLAIIAEIFPARERDTGLVNARQLVEGIARRPAFAPKQKQVLYGGDVEATTALLRDQLRTNDLLILMGAGDIYKVTEDLLQGSSDSGR